MGKKKRDKKYWKRRFGDLGPETIEPYYHHFDLRRFDNLDDEGFAYLLTSVKGVNMLDLNETEITNESIAILPRLEYVYELRLKGVYGIDNGCIPDLNKLDQLSFLHVNHTGITIDGLLQLTNLQALRTLLFTADDAESIREEILQLHALLPQCELVVNSKPQYFEEEQNWQV
ncbi:MAG TPA: hypothetical protein VLC98_11720 [Phnomibacter sp.]|nr:hypothetical protein [Phnomibacter sp.]